MHHLQHGTVKKKKLFITNQPESGSEAFPKDTCLIGWLDGSNGLILIVLTFPVSLIFFAKVLIGTKCSIRLINTTQNIIS